MKHLGNICKWCTSDYVTEQLPLKQGLKQNAKSLENTVAKIVTEQLPLKQGLKLRDR